MTEIAKILLQIREKAVLSQTELAKMVGTSLVSVVRWETGALSPSPAQETTIKHIYHEVLEGKQIKLSPKQTVFASKGAREKDLPPFKLSKRLTLSKKPLPPILSCIMDEKGFFKSETSLENLLHQHSKAAVTVNTAPHAGMSAGKNTYTYDAHTYHTKVPPQGIAELLKHYLPEGGLVLDPFAGSGMTGVAAQVLGYSCILTELSPAAAFIANRFSNNIDPELFQDAVDELLLANQDLRKQLYQTHHRETNAPIEVEYFIWSYRVTCYHCQHEFSLWDACRSYGKSVREHKILSEFDCPNCQEKLKKSRLQRKDCLPVSLAYKESNSISFHPLEAPDWKILTDLETHNPLAEGFYPQVPLYQGINLRQPMRHGIDTIAKMYTPRNLLALSYLWKTIHHIKEDNLAAFLAFTFTSLYQRVSRFSEFRFWGGSGNTAHFNLPFISKEANVFTSFERKARTIQDHLQTTASHYHGKTQVLCASATHLEQIPDESIDLIFTDPPFGANINYSEMNILWESWLGQFTDNQHEVIINKYQEKSIKEYQTLIQQSLAECYRVLRTGHWLLLAFMNSSQEVWEALRFAIKAAGFTICQVDIFDKQHNTFKQLVSENTVGVDLILHCQKIGSSTSHSQPIMESLESFLDKIRLDNYVIRYIHVNRKEEFDFRTLYSEWLAQNLENNQSIMDFVEFKNQVQAWIDKKQS
jgi:DNA modification methylase/DNA-binding XRE family transcriptional regulator